MDTRQQAPSTVSPKPVQPVAYSPSPGRLYGAKKIPKNGLQIPRNFPFEAWIRLGEELSSFATSSAWCLGDWLIYGESFFSGRYRAAIERTSLEYQTLRNCAWVARKFPFDRRHDALSFGHHAEVASLPEPEQDFWLRKAESLGWSRNALRNQVRLSLRERANDAGHENNNLSGAESKIAINVTSEQLRVCEKAAETVGLPLNAWIARTLNAAAQEVLQTGYYAHAGGWATSGPANGGDHLDEERLRVLWSAALQGPVAGDTHFFVAGGDSLSGALLVAQTNSEFGADLTLVDLIDHATFNEFSRLLSAGDGETGQ
jgi:hypothetical protein